MKRTTYYSLIVILASLFALTSCDRLTDNNGDLGGMWQLTSWLTRNSETGNIDKPVADKTDNIYYSVHRTLFRFSKNSATNYHLATFEHTASTLTFRNIVHFPSDDVCTAADLAKYGVPASGTFHIDVLNDDELVLSDPDNVLTFRKY